MDSLKDSVLASTLCAGILLTGMVSPLGAQVVDSIPDRFPADSLVDSSEAEADTLERPYSGPLPPTAANALAYILTAAPDTPEGMGLLATGRAEAQIALQHAAFAGRDSTNLGNMQRHMAHVIHAVDPGQGSQGPGMGYGVRQTARQILAQIESAQGVDGVPGALTFHGPRVAMAARGTNARVDEVIALARQVQSAGSAAAGNRLVRQLAEAVRAMAYGLDRDGDRRIGHTEDEMGLAQIGHHLALVERLTR
ncbi:MAG: hypothetical protein HKN72_05230 [Gemmatimonadetes bacterium]|nr:hypothetical protein [Gemmatimonadota bacterium]